MAGPAKRLPWDPDEEQGTACTSLEKGGICLLPPYNRAALQRLVQVQFGAEQTNAPVIPFWFPHIYCKYWNRLQVPFWYIMDDVFLTKFVSILALLLEQEKKPQCNGKMPFMQAQDLKKQSCSFPSIARLLPNLTLLWKASSLPSTIPPLRSLMLSSPHGKLSGTEWEHRWL